MKSRQDTCSAVTMDTGTASDIDGTSLCFDSNGRTSRPNLYDIKLLFNEVAKEDAYFFRSDDFVADAALGLRVRRGNEHLNDLLTPKIQVIPTSTHTLLKTVRNYASWNVKQRLLEQESAVLEST